MRPPSDAAPPRDATFAEVAEAMSLGLPYRIWMNAEGTAVRFLQVGAACLDILGVHAEDVLADPTAFARLIPESDRARMFPEWSAALAERRSRSAEFRVRRPDGELRWCRVVSAPLRWNADGSSEWNGLVVDVTERKRLAEQLAEERRRLEQAIELSGMGVFHWERSDPDDAVECSDRQCAIWGLAPDTPVRVQAFVDRVHPEDQGLVRDGMLACRNAPDGGECYFEHRIVRPDGQVRWVLEHHRIERDADGLKSVHGTTLDVTERRNAEEQRRLQVRELVHRSKNALTVLTALLQHAAKDSGSVEELVAVLMRRIEAMAKSQDLATASDGGPMPLAALVARTLDAFDLSRFDLDPGLQAVTVPGEAVMGAALLLHELATNATKYGALSSEAGRVRISPVPAPAGRVAIEWREVGGPAVQAPSRQGFGMRLLAAALQAHGGGVEPIFAPEGFVARIEMEAR